MPQLPKIVRVATVPLSLKSFCRELMLELASTYDVLAVSSPGDELDSLAADGIRVTPVAMERRIAPLSDLRSLAALVRLFRRERPQIVHSVTPKAGLLSMMAARIAGVPVRVHTFTGLLFPTATGFKRRLLATTDRITCLCATHIVPEGYGVKADLERAGITSKSMQVLGHGNLRGVDLDYYRPTDDVREKARLLREGFGIPAGDFVFLFTGRIVGSKGIDELISAFTDVASRNQHLWLLIAGVPEENDPISKTAADTIASHPRIHVSDGWLSDLRPWYAAADSLVFPSYREGFPNAVLEAGAFSLPSVVTDINGSREIITDGDNGYIVPPHDAHALAAAIEKIISDPANSRKMGRRALQNVADKYQASYIRDCHKKLYASLLRHIYQGFDS